MASGYFLFIVSLALYLALCVPVSSKKAEEEAFFLQLLKTHRMKAVVSSKTPEQQIQLLSNHIKTAQAAAQGMLD